MITNYKNLFIKIIEIIVITFVSILSIYLLGIMLKTIYRENIVEQIIQEKHELNY